VRSSGYVASMISTLGILSTSITSSAAAFRTSGLVELLMSENAFIDSGERENL
jgi:hypothetical protein